MRDAPSEAIISKVDTDRGLVFGWAIISKQADEGGELKPYYDLQSDYIPEDAMLDASMGFMAHSRAAGEMHKSDGEKYTFGDHRQVGHVLFALPVTEDLTKAFGLGAPDRTGLIIGMKVDDPEVLAKFDSGEYTGFSIEGKRLAQAWLDDDGKITKEEEFDV